MPGEPRVELVMRACVVAFAVVGAGCARSRPHVAERPVPLNTPVMVAATYPDLLRTANIEGCAKMRFLLDSAGRPIPESVRILGATHDGFAFALRHSARRWRFSVAESGDDGRRRDTITVDARFVLEDGPTCPHPPPCANAPIRLPPPTERIEGHRGSREIRILIASCPMPERSHCVSSIGVREQAE